MNKIITLWHFYMGEKGDCTYPINQHPFVGEVYELFLENSDKSYGTGKITGHNINDTWEVTRIS